ncbi:MAG: helix-turn-helix domain-containing protein [Alphaproteobacteria bacterium]|nr:helix-turn-helix domain-containing protein [Alphaproteobacteria bacterium]
MATAVLVKHSAPVRSPAVASRAAYLRPVPATPSTASPLDKVGTSVAYVRGRTVIEEGNPAEYVYKVVSGAMRKVRLLPDGRRHIISFLMPGDFFGFAEGRNYAHAVEAVADVTLVRYSRRGFEAVLEQDPRAGRHFLGLVCKALSATQDQLLLLGRKSALERMASFLVALSDRIGADHKPGAEFDLPMNRSDVADYLGLTIETVSRLVTRLRSLGVIDTPDAHRIVILKRDALEDLSTGNAGEA